MSNQKHLIREMKHWKRDKLLEEYLTHAEELSTNATNAEVRRDIAKTLIEFKDANLLLAFSEIMAYFSTAIIIFTVVQIMFIVVLYSSRIPSWISWGLILVVLAWFARLVSFSHKVKKDLKKYD